MNAILSGPGESAILQVLLINQLIDAPVRYASLLYWYHMRFTRNKIDLEI